MPANTYNLVWNNVRSLVTMRDETKSDVVIGIGFVVTKDNWREVLTCIRMTKEHRVSNMRISAVFQTDDIDYFSDFGADARKLCKQAEGESTDEFTVINSFDDRLSDMTQKTPKNRLCYHQFLVPYIGADLNLYRCCVLSYKKQGLVGSLANRRLRDFWGTPEWKDIMYDYDARTCPRCQFNDKNAVMHELVGAFAMPHVNHL
jgi:hypothetical protein